MAEDFPNKPFGPIMTKLIVTSALLLLAGLSQAAFACDRLPPEDADQHTARATNLSAAWSDAMILQNLKLPIGRADVKRAQSSSSVTAEYTYFHKIVTITRSASSGVQVKLVENGQDTLVWKLGTCARNVPGRTDAS
jgi:hypothetical protein